MEYFVAPYGNNSNSGVITSPFQTLAHGLSVLAPGDILFLLDGVYATQLLETGFGATGTAWTAGDFITVAGYAGQKPIIRPTGSVDNIVRFQDASVHHVQLQDLIFDGGGITSGAGPGSQSDVSLGDSGSVSHDIRLVRCEVKDSYGTGIHMFGTGHQLIDVNLHGCGREPSSIYPQGHNGVYSETDGALILRGEYWNCKSLGIRFGTSSPGGADGNQIVGARVHDNGAGHGLNGTSDGGSIGGGILLADVDNSAVNCVIYRNQEGVILYGLSGKNVSSPLIHHCTITLNDVGVEVTALAEDAEIKNSIVQGNGTDINDSGTDTVTANNITGATDPLFLNAGARDFRLRAGSPAIDAGADLSIASDFDQLTRPFGTAPDIGAYEWGSTTPADDFVPTPRASIGFVNGSGTWTTPATAFDHTGQASSTTYNPPSGSAALASQNLWAWIACALGEVDIDEVYGSDATETDTGEPKRRLIGWNEGTIMGPDSDGWPHAERYRVVGDIRQSGFYARALPLKHHRDRSVTFAWNGRGWKDPDGLMVDQVFRQLLLFLNEVVEKNDGLGYRDGDYGPIEAFADGTPKFWTSKFEVAQQITAVWLGTVKGYIGRIVVTEPTALSEILRRFFNDYGGHLTSSARQVYPYLIDLDPAPGAGRLYRERMEIARLTDHKYAHDQRENRITYDWDYNFDTKAFAVKAAETKRQTSINRAGGDKIGVFETPPKQCYFANDQDTLADRQERALDLYEYSPRFVAWSTNLKSLPDYNGKPARFSHRKEGLGLSGETGTPGVITNTKVSATPYEVIQAAMLFRSDEVS